MTSDMNLVVAVDHPDQQNKRPGGGFNDFYALFYTLHPSLITFTSCLHLYAQLALVVSI